MQLQDYGQIAHFKRSDPIDSWSGFSGLWLDWGKSTETFPSKVVRKLQRTSQKVRKFKAPKCLSFHHIQANY
jgi:hypothetical protein